MIGGQIDEKKLKSIGDNGVSAMICDSTNIFSPGRAGSESEVRDSLLRIMELKLIEFLLLLRIKCSSDGVNILLCKKNWKKYLFSWKINAKNL